MVGHQLPKNSCSSKRPKSEVVEQLCGQLEEYLKGLLLFTTCVTGTLASAGKERREGLIRRREGLNRRSLVGRPGTGEQSWGSTPNTTSEVEMSQTGM